MVAGGVMLHTSYAHYTIQNSGNVILSVRFCFAPGVKLFVSKGLAALETDCGGCMHLKSELLSVEFRTKDFETKIGFFPLV